MGAGPEKAFPTSPKSALSSRMTRLPLLPSTQAVATLAPAERVPHWASGHKVTPVRAALCGVTEGHAGPLDRCLGRPRRPSPGWGGEGHEIMLFQRDGRPLLHFPECPSGAPIGRAARKVTPRKQCHVCQPQRRRQSDFGTRRRIIPSCATLATSRPSRSKIRPRLKPRPPPLHGLSVA